MDSCYSSGLSSSLSSEFTKRKAFRRTPMNNNKRIIKKKRISSTACHPLSTLDVLIIFFRSSALFDWPWVCPILLSTSAAVADDLMQTGHSTQCWVGWGGSRFLLVIFVLYQLKLEKRQSLVVIYGSLYFFCR
ncbi:hypothetical protein D917_09035 [Trichinella nativa]|uniref:Uncharacterized protein n=1 Tax=Trichinella nativa TaxID=6335 RepID=A0A1Y3EN43_9BILA|nr:hypothetical protein D917_09035 [Trichinella nativa]